VAKRRRKTIRIRDRETLQEAERYKSNFSWTKENYGAKKDAREAGYIDLTPPAPANERFMRFKERTEEIYGHKVPPWAVPYPMHGTPEDLLEANPGDEDIEDEEFHGGFVGRPEGWER